MRRVYADAASVKEWAGTLTDAALRCRDMGHTWQPHTASWNAEARAYERRLRCPRCTTIRAQMLSNSGEVLSNHYLYPEGYLADFGRIVGEGRNALRLESVTRAVTASGGNVRPLRRKRRA